MSRLFGGDVLRDACDVRALGLSRTRDESNAVSNGNAIKYRVPLDTDVPRKPSVLR